MKEKNLIYLRCPNCGKYFTNKEEKENKFCSDECKIYYKSCAACGNYFASSRIDNKIYCSNECGINPYPQDLQKESLQIHQMTPAQVSREIPPEQDLSLLQQPWTLSADSL